MRWVVVLGLLCLCRVGAAQVSCPWLTVGTAEKVLGASAKTEVKMLAPPRVEEGRCLFTASSGTLEIVVSGDVLEECAHGEKVRGVGNEARFCSASAAGSSACFSVEGRVRTMYFRTTLIAAAKANDGRKRVELIAELVAGNLF